VWLGLGLKIMRYIVVSIVFCAILSLKLLFIACVFFDALDMYRITGRFYQNFWMLYLDLVKRWVGLILCIILKISSFELDSCYFVCLHVRVLLICVILTLSVWMR